MLAGMVNSIAAKATKLKPPNGQANTPTKLRLFFRRGYSLSTCRPLVLRGPPELWNHALAVGLYKVLLVTPDVVDVDLVEP